MCTRLAYVSPPRSSPIHRRRREKSFRCRSSWIFGPARRAGARPDRQASSRQKVGAPVRAAAIKMPKSIPSPADVGELFGGRRSVSRRLARPLGAPWCEAR
jgi:hypothetical protein